MEILLAHLLGDYVFQNHWMANEKTSKSLAALLHVTIYTACYLAFYFVIPMSWEGYALIGVTHFVMDRWRLAKYWCRFYGVGEKAFFQSSDVQPAPPFLAAWLLILVDNTIHLTINWAALQLFGI